MHLEVRSCGDEHILVLGNGAPVLLPARAEVIAIAVPRLERGGVKLAFGPAARELLPLSPQGGVGGERHGDVGPPVLPRRAGGAGRAGGVAVEFLEVGLRAIRVSAVVRVRVSPI